jgi:hypothetical protein
LSVDGASPVRAKVSEIISEYVNPGKDTTDDGSGSGPENSFRVVAGDD